MSRPGRRSGDDLAYGDYNRWDRDRFDRSGRLPPTPPEPPRRFEEDFRFEERDRPGRRDVLVEDRTESRGPRGRYEERDRIFRETFGDGGRRRTDRELFGDVDPRDLADMAMTPYKNRGEKEIDITIKESRGGRPGVVRRQSSLDTFDRRPIPRYDRDEYRIAPYQPIPLPIRREDERRDDGTYREVEVKRERSVHRRSGKKSRVSSVSSSSSSSESEVEDVKSKVSKASKPPNFKKGKTKVPKRLVFKEAILDLGYPFVEEDHFYILQVALEKEQIDEVIKVSETYKSADKHKSFRYEERIEEDSQSVSKVDTPDRRGRETIIRKEYVNPPSDFLGTELPNRSRSSRRAHSPSIESSISQRISPSRSRARSVYREERRTVVEEGEGRTRPATIVIPGGIIEERAPSGALVLQEREYRSDADIKAEILALEAERRALRYERDGDMQLAVIREARPSNEIIKIVERERSPPRNVLRVERDRKGRMALVRSAH